MPQFNFNRLVRFKSPSGQVHYGHVEGSGYSAETLLGISVPIYEGGNPWDPTFQRIEAEEEIAEVIMTPIPRLCPPSKKLIETGLKPNRTYAHSLRYWP